MFKPGQARRRNEEEGDDREADEREDDKLEGQAESSD